MPAPPPAPFDSCAICQNPPYNTKGGDSCRGCPAYTTAHYFPEPDGARVPQLLVLADVPEAPRLHTLSSKAPRFERPKEVVHRAFTDDGGKVVRAAIEVQLSRMGEPDLPVSYLYAAKCAVRTPSKSVLHHCQTFLWQEIKRVRIIRDTASFKGDPVILVCGLNAAHALGIKVHSEKALLGRVFRDVPFADGTVTAVATRSLAKYAAAAGMFTTLCADIERAVRVLRNTEPAVLPRAEVEKGYVYPRTNEEVRALIDMVIAYGGPDWVIAWDTETNTLHPHWTGLRALTFTLSWDKGKAASIALWHPQTVEWCDTPYSPELAWMEIERLFASNKPLIGFNGKFDFKVVWRTRAQMREKGYDVPAGTQPVGNMVWDGLLAEHSLEEDKQGEYGLKALTKRFKPELSGYEDRLHDLLEAEETRASHGEASEKPSIELRLPPEVAAVYAKALERKWVTSPKFQTTTIEKMLAELDAKKGAAT